MGEVTFRILRKLLCMTLILSLLWPDLAKCMDDEENSQQQRSNIPQNLLQNNTSDQKEDLPFTKNSPLPTILKEKKTSSENLKTEDNPENNSEKTHVFEDITNKEENISENKIPSEDTNTSSQELKEKEDNTNTETLSPQTTSLPKENELNKEIKKEGNDPLQRIIEIIKEGEEGGFGTNIVNIIEIREEGEKGENNPKNSFTHGGRRRILRRNTILSHLLQKTHHRRLAKLETGSGGYWGWCGVRDDGDYLAGCRTSKCNSL